MCVLHSVERHCVFTAQCRLVRVFTAQCTEVRVCTAQCREVRVCTAQCRESLFVLHSLESFCIILLN